jgi:DNA-binding IclR family transcriptional regulator
MGTRGQSDGRYTIRSLHRAIDILNLLSDGQPRLLTQVSAAAGLNSSTAFRVLTTLTDRNFVERDAQTGKYRLGIASLELARAYQDGHHLRRLALPILQALRNETGETVHLAVLDHMDVVYLDKLQSFRAVGIMSSHVGARLPAYCTGLGKALLAFSDPALVREYLARHPLERLTATTISEADALLRELEQICCCGYALDRGEREAEIRCVAAPLFGRRGALLAAISVAGPDSRMEPLETNQPIIDRVVAAARAISVALGYREDRWPPGYHGQAERSRPTAS